MLDLGRATAVAHPNIAFIKYWGNADDTLRLPANPSLSMNLGGLATTTSVTFDPDLTEDVVVIDGVERQGAGRERVVRQLDEVRALASAAELGFGALPIRARVESSSNFPVGAGIASSASAFAALTTAAAAALDLKLSEAELSALARLGSGSACRSIPAGFVEWRLGERHEDSYAVSIAPPEHWELRDVVAVVSTGHKETGSSDGHRLAPTSFLHAARVRSVPERLADCKAALLARDIEALGREIEVDAVAMHAVMMTSRPQLHYWLPGTVAVIQQVLALRREGVPVYFTIDAGPNVHCLCPNEDSAKVADRLRALPFVGDILVAGPGGAARLVAADP